MRQSARGAQAKGATHGSRGDVLGAHGAAGTFLSFGISGLDANDSYNEADVNESYIDDDADSDKDDVGENENNNAIRASASFALSFDSQHPSVGGRGIVSICGV